MDAMMAEANIRKLSRMELIYTCISKLAAYVEKTGSPDLPEGLEHYTDPNGFNREVYHQRSTGVDEYLEQMGPQEAQMAMVALFVVLPPTS